MEPAAPPVELEKTPGPEPERKVDEVVEKLAEALDTTQDKVVDKLMEALDENPDAPPEKVAEKIVEKSEDPPTPDQPPVIFVEQGKKAPTVVEEPAKKEDQTVVVVQELNRAPTVVSLPRRVTTKIEQESDNPIEAIAEVAKQAAAQAEETTNATSEKIEEVQKRPSIIILSRPPTVHDEPILTPPAPEPPAPTPAPEEPKRVPTRLEELKVASGEPETQSTLSRRRRARDRFRKLILKCGGAKLLAWLKKRKAKDEAQEDRAEVARWTP